MVFVLTSVIQKLRYSIYENRIENVKYSTIPSFTRIIEKERNKRPLHVVYVLNHVGICGGTKVILEHANGLKKLGAIVTLISNFPKPDWFNIEVNYICVPFELEVTRHIPVCDVIVATYWEHISACVEVGIAPVVYFEQGDFHLYEWDTLDKNMQSMIYKQFQMPFDIMTVSNQTASIIKRIFNREAKVVPNSLNKAVFYPKDNVQAKKYMLIVGREETKFKGIDDLKKVFIILKEKGYDLELVWITQTEPTHKMGQVYISPSQEKLGQLYRDAFVYVCGSYYESFPLPPLEAMASGTPVVTTNNIGINDYAKDQINCLMVEPGDIEGLVNKIEQLLSNEQLYKTMQKNGIDTSSEYNWEVILKNLFNYFQECSLNKIVKKYDKDEWNLHFNLKDFVNQESSKKINQLLEQLDADRIQLPVVYELIPGLPFVRWETLITRKHPNFNNKVEKIDLKIKGTDYFSKCNYAEGVRLFLKEEFLFALQYFMNKLKQVEIGAEDHGITVKWVSLCLLELKMDDMLVELLDEALKVHYKYTDLYYIKAMVHNERQEFEKAMELINICKYIQDACFYEEHISDIKDVVNNMLNFMNSTVLA
jgi:glycosyltransferase involved in cell wall biosynthesis